MVFFNIINHNELERVFCQTNNVMYESKGQYTGHNEKAQLICRFSGIHANFTSVANYQT